MGGSAEGILTSKDFDVGNVVSLKPLPAKQAAFCFSFVQDDYAVKVTLDGDIRFFVRIETRAREVVVTDFHPGNLDEFALGRALSDGLRVVRIRKLSSLVFQDLLAGADPEVNAATLRAVTTHARRASDAVANERGQVVEGVSFLRGTRKLDLVISFARKAEL